MYIQQIKELLGHKSLSVFITPEPVLKDHLIGHNTSL